MRQRCRYREALLPAGRDLRHNAGQDIGVFNIHSVICVAIKPDERSSRVSPMHHFGRWFRVSASMASLEELMRSSG